MQKVCTQKVATLCNEKDATLQPRCIDIAVLYQCYKRPRTPLGSKFPNATVSVVVWENMGVMQPLDIVKCVHSHARKDATLPSKT